MSFPILSFVLWLPMASLLVLLFLPTDRWAIFRHIALGTILLQGLGVIYVFVRGSGGVEHCPWMCLRLGGWGWLSIDYRVGVDGLNAGLLALAVVVLAVGVVASWRVRTSAKAYFALYLLLDVSVIGSFLALDLLLFYVFFEMTLLPVYFFIGVWGGGQRTRAATKFILYTLLGAIPVLVIVLGLGLSVYDPVATGVRLGLLVPGEALTLAKVEAIQRLVLASSVPAEAVVHSFSWVNMQDVNNFLPGAFLSGMARVWAFGALLMGFCIKMAVVPFHTWLPDAHVAAPTPISMVLAGILLKMGGYGLLRIAYSIFPEGALYYSSTVGGLGILSILYAALNALAMRDLKRMVAYASVAHMGFVLLGLGSLTAEGFCGALYHMVGHGLVAVMLFGVVGVLEDRVQDRDITHYSGLASSMPHYVAVAVVVFFVALGLPGFSGFIGEFLVLLGAFRASGWWGMLGALGILLNAAYWVWTIQRMFWGRFSVHSTVQEGLLQDLGVREGMLFVLLLLLALLLGVFPNWLLGGMDDAVGELVRRVNAVGGVH